MSDPNQSDLCIVSYPIGKAFTTPISNLSTIFSEINNTNVILGSYDPVCISKNKALEVHFISHRSGPSRFLQIIRYTLLNIKIILTLFSLRQLYGRTIFFMDSCPVLPMFFSLLCGKRTFWLLPSKISLVSQGFLSRIEIFLSYIGYWISDGIIVYSPNLIAEWQLEPYRHKIHIAHEHFININTFTVITPISGRRLLIGYIGRFSGEKGVQNFVQALPAIFSARKDISVLIGGEGELKESIEAYLQEEGLTTRVDLHGWISHDDLPRCLNQLQLLVLPSYTEGLPNIMLEAMACGTPVLATPVGAIPDIIKDGETGFIMEDNSPVCIAENIIRVLEHPNLENIAMNAKKIVENEFTFKSTVMQWKRIFEEICAQ